MAAMATAQVAAPAAAGAGAGSVPVATRVATTKLFKNAKPSKMLRQAMRDGTSVPILFFRRAYAMDDVKYTGIPVDDNFVIAYCAAFPLVTYDHRGDRKMLRGSEVCVQCHTKIGGTGRMICADPKCRRKMRDRMDSTDVYIDCDVEGSIMGGIADGWTPPADTSPEFKASCVSFLVCKIAEHTWKYEAEKTKISRYGAIGVRNGSSFVPGKYSRASIVAAATSYAKTYPSEELTAALAAFELTWAAWCAAYRPHDITIHIMCDSTNPGIIGADGLIDGVREFADYTHCEPGSASGEAGVYLAPSSQVWKFREEFGLFLGTVPRPVKEYAAYDHTENNYGLRSGDDDDYCHDYTEGLSGGLAPGY